MFSLHETTQRRLCRTVFVLGCLLPTLCTLAWTLWFHRPSHERDWQAWINSTLHVRAEVGAVRAPQPGVRELQSVRLFPLLSQRPLATFESLRCTRGGDGWEVIATGGHVAGDALSALAKTFAICLASEQCPISRIDAEQLQVGFDGKTTPLTDCALRFNCRSDGSPKLVLQAQLPQHDGGARDLVKLQMDRAADGSVHAACDTGRTALPGSLFAGHIPGSGRWRSARFTGRLLWQADGDSTSGTLVGTLAGIDTTEWLGTDNHHHLQSTAILEFDGLSWSGSRIVRAEGSLQLGPGTISPSLLQACSESLYCTVGSVAGASGSQELSFDTIACRFRLTHDGLTVSGTCPTSANVHAGSLAVAGGQTLLMQPKYSALPLGQLAQVFLPRGKSWLPATRAAAELATVLPLPEPATGSPVEVAHRHSSGLNRR